MPLPSELEGFFQKYRTKIIGIDHEIELPYGRRKLLYADWTASGRLFQPIEDFMVNTVGPWIANTHTESTSSGQTMTRLYHEARAVIKRHVGGKEEDILIPVGQGMTSAVNKLQRILNLRVPEPFIEAVQISGAERPLVIITAMEHHSNQTSWEECFCDVQIIRRAENGLPDLNHLRQILLSATNRKTIYGSFTACSNVTGIITPYYEMAEILHEFGGFCFVDFAASAPYVQMDMHPANEKQKLDAIFFSPHKFLGGPGATGILAFGRELYRNKTPDQPGGGTVAWTNPWGEHRFFNDIETREDGGTPAFLQTIRAALAIQLKEEMGIERILRREHELSTFVTTELQKNPAIHLLESHLSQQRRLGIISFYSLHMHHNLVVKLLNDRFGVQSRGGCSCAGTYGHLLLNVDHAQSLKISDQIDHGDLSEKPGWVRISVHPTMSTQEAAYLVNSIHEVIGNYDSWKEDYRFERSTGEFSHRTSNSKGGGGPSLKDFCPSPPEAAEKKGY